MKTAKKETEEVKTPVPEVAAVVPTPTEPEIVHKVEPTPVLSQNLAFVDEVIALKARLDSQRQEAIDRLLNEKSRIEAQLSILGHTENVPAARRPVFRKAAGAGPSSPSRPSSRPATTGGAPFCKYCNEAGHDARAHRGQAVKKKFTQAELAAL